MAQGRSTIEAGTVEGPVGVDGAAAVDTGFGAEFRELARQRRFVRAADTTPGGEQPASWRDAASPQPAGSDWRDDAAPPRRARHAAAPVAPAAPLPAPAPTPTPAAVAVTRTAAPLPSSGSLRRAASAPRISEDQRATLRELARMSDRLVDAREQLAAATTRGDQLAAELDAARSQLRAEEQRVIASRMLVHDAQQTTREVAERCAWLEARCETLQEALELAVNASWTTRWRWRREHRARARG